MSFFKGLARFCIGLDIEATTSTLSLFLNFWEKATDKIPSVAEMKSVKLPSTVASVYQGLFVDMYGACAPHVLLVHGVVERTLPVTGSNEYLDLIEVNNKNKLAFMKNS